MVKLILFTLKSTYVNNNISLSFYSLDFKERDTTASPIFNSTSLTNSLLWLAERFNTFTSAMLSGIFKCKLPIFVTPYLCRQCSIHIPLFKSQKSDIMIYMLFWMYQGRQLTIRTLLTP